MQVHKAQKPPHILPVQVDFFLDPPASALASPPPTTQAATPTKTPRKSPITIVEHKQDTAPARIKPVGENRFYDIMFQFAPPSEQKILTKEEFNVAERLDPHNPRDEEGEGDLKLAQQLAEAMKSSDDVHDPDAAIASDADDVVDVFTITKSDSSEQRLAKAMFSRMLFDLAAIKPTSADIIDDANLDFFGQSSITTRKSDYTQLRKFDALIWIFDLNPDKPLVSFEWVCEMLGFDEDRIRRITARSVKKELRQVLRYIAGMIEPEHARACELAMSEYINLESWQDF